jgi:hypothetical protein
MTSGGIRFHREGEPVVLYCTEAVFFVQDDVLFDNPFGDDEVGVKIKKFPASLAEQLDSKLFEFISSGHGVKFHIAEEKMRAAFFGNGALSYPSYVKVRYGHRITDDSCPATPVLYASIEGLFVPIPAKTGKKYAIKNSEELFSLLLGEYNLVIERTYFEGLGLPEVIEDEIIDFICAEKKLAEKEKDAQKKFASLLVRDIGEFYTFPEERKKFAWLRLDITPMSVPTHMVSKDFYKFTMLTQDGPVFLFDKFVSDGGDTDKKRFYRMLRDWKLFYDFSRRTFNNLKPLTSLGTRVAKKLSRPTSRKCA